MSARVCTVEGCDNAAIARGWCPMHYRRWKKHGEVGGPAPMRQGPPRKPLTPDDERHGTANGYTNLRCRCEPCTAAWADWHRAWMHADPERLAKHAGRARLRRAAREDAS